jgi:molybdopterin-guanine dinucleotide biosynthesis protein A
MGRNKALLPFRGTTLARAIAGAVEAAAGSVALVGNSGDIPDLYPGEGPLGGILTALQNSTADWNLVVACDMPALSPGFLRQLLDAADGCEGDALVPAGPNRRLEPLCAAYRRRSLPGLSSAFARGIRKVAVALEEVPTVTWPVPEVYYFQNVNTPEDWVAYGR